MHCSTTCGAFKVTEKFPMDAPLVNGKEIAVELRAVCKEARQRKTREDDDRRRGERERAKAKIKASARNTTYKSLIGTLIKLELGGK